MVSWKFLVSLFQTQTHPIPHCNSKNDKLFRLSFLLRPLLANEIRIHYGPLCEFFHEVVPLYLFLCKSLCVNYVSRKLCPSNPFVDLEIVISHDTIIFMIKSSAVHQNIHPCILFKDFKLYKLTLIKTTIAL